MAVRAAAAGDLPALRAVEAAVFGAGAYPGFFFRQALDALPAFFLVAEAEGRLVGYTLGAAQPGDGHGWILSLGVDPAARGRGAGRALVAALLEAFAARGAREVFLHVSPSNRAAIALYERLGFEVVREERDWFGPGEDRLILRRGG
ncbi:MAG TPA: GNAT family N-acetyltransferase [Longimicrobium sp.]|nr:GNAT family N-acetyltransferase [Longimicrobium sp.]